MISPLLGGFLYGKHRFLHISDGITRITSNGGMTHIPDYIVGYLMLLIPLFNVYKHNIYIYIFIYLRSHILHFRYYIPIVTRYILITSPHDIPMPAMRHCAAIEGHGLQELWCRCKGTLREDELVCQWGIYNQWEFQDPKLEVPTIYKAYIRAM